MNRFKHLFFNHQTHVARKRNPTSRITRIKNKSKHLILTVTAMTYWMMSLPVIAGTEGGELSVVNDHLIHIIQGSGGKLIGLVALVLAIVGSVARFNVHLIIGLFGTLMMIAFGVNIIDSTLTAPI